MAIARTTKTSIINAALATLGQEPIVSLDDETSSQSSVRMALAKFDIMYREFLAGHDWNCARRVVKLVQVDTQQQVDKGWEYCYMLPTNPEFMRITKISVDGGQHYYTTNAYYNKYSGGKECAFDIDGDYLYANMTPVFIEYIGVIDPSDMDPLLASAFSYMLATELAYAIPASVSLADYLYQQYRQKLKTAKSRDAMNRNPRQYDGDVIQARYSMSGGGVDVDHSDEE